LSGSSLKFDSQKILCRNNLIRTVKALRQIDWAEITENTIKKHKLKKVREVKWYSNIDWWKGWKVLRQ
jgi:hypothetical protein